ncbi:hypothetical protein FOMPIDRAFT_1048503 [Fomitopsis schrenkii]|uniref:F-box domain-containing protein n=1 Tax=Fomitopsis schrenkii TaxID=2126942 RepID=S8FKI5_FOMSC|nr:hypothetical protein FOMPIDRAFT_1048503 [Fomitopsis schrenkii]
MAVFEWEEANIKISISPPRYSDYPLPHPPLPQEIYDYTIDFLWYDPAALARCCSVCRAFVPVAAYHLDQFTTLQISSHASVTLYARAFRAKENRRFNRVDDIMMIESPRSPFIHRFSISMLGCYLPGVKTLTLNGIDWTITCPHVSFFEFLPLYSGITELTLSWCKFRNASQLRRLINALPGLNKLWLLGIDWSTLCDVPTTTVLRPALNANRIQGITLFYHFKQTDPRGFVGSRDAMRNILTFCAQYSSVSQLSLDLELLDSIACLLRFLHHFPLLSDLDLHGEPYTSSVDVSEWQDFELGALRQTHIRLSNLSLRCIPTIAALSLMQLFPTPEACSNLDSIKVKHSDGTGPVALFLQAMQDTLRLAGAALREFDFGWDCNRGLLFERGTEWDFAANISLTKLLVTLRPPPRPYAIGSILVSMISSITSPCLEVVSIYLAVTDPSTSEAHQPFSGGDVLQCRGSKAVDDFHTILNASHFHGLPPRSVKISIDARQSTLTAPIEVIRPVKYRLDKLFSPWLARNVLKIYYDPEPENEEEEDEEEDKDEDSMSYTNVSTEDTTHAHTDQVGPENNP